MNVDQSRLTQILSAADSLKIKGLVEAATPPEPSKHKPKKEEYSPPLTTTMPPNPGSMKRKRGRPRILDSPGESLDPCFAKPSTSTAAPSSAPTEAVEPKKIKANNNLPLPEPQTSPVPSGLSGLGVPPPSSTGSSKPTPGGPLTPQRVRELGIVRMSEYLNTGTRQQFWDEDFVKIILQVISDSNTD